MAPPSSCLLAALPLLGALSVLLPGHTAGLPITSRPIEGTAQRMAWEDWLSLGPERQTLEKEKKVTAKSILTLPFRHCPPGHTLYNQLCIPQSNIDPTKIIVQELILAGASDGKPPPPPIADYDYSDVQDEESEEIAYDIADMQPPSGSGLGSGSGSGSGSGAPEDQALPSEDAPLKFNIFEKKFPTGTGEPEPDLLAAAPTTPATNSTLSGNVTASNPAAAMPPPSPLEYVSIQPEGGQGNRIPGGDLQAAPSNAMTTTATLTPPRSNSNSSSAGSGVSGNSSRIDIGNVEAIVLPAGRPLDGSLVQLVTGSLTDSDNDSDTDTDSDSEADANVNVNDNGYGNANANALAMAMANANAEADLAQLLKDDAFVPAYEGSIEVMQPPFSHRRVAPPLSANVEEEGAPKGSQDAQTDADELEDSSEEASGDPEETTTDIVPTTEEEEEIETKTETETEREPEPEPEGETEVATSTGDTTEETSGNTETTLTPTTMEPSPSPSPSPTPTPSVAVSASDSVSGSSSSSSSVSVSVSPATPPPRGIDEGNDRLVFIKSKVQPVQVTTTATSTSTAATATATDTTATATETTTSADGSTTLTLSSTAATSMETSVPPAATTLSISNRSNRNSKIIRVESAEAATTPATAAAAAAAAAPTTISSNNISDGYAPFWWLPNIGWRVERQVDRNGEDRSLLLRFFSTFRGSGSGSGSGGRSSPEQGMR